MYLVGKNENPDEKTVSPSLELQLRAGDGGRDCWKRMNEKIPIPSTRRLG